MSEAGDTSERGQQTGSDRGTPPRPVRSPEEQLFDELIFKSELNEVYLLIDFVSGRPDRNLDRLTMPNPAMSATTLSSAAIVERISLMRYPPNGDPIFNAKDAAFLALAKDQLSALASPTRGLTIAYTMMFVDAEGYSLFRRGHEPRRRPRQPPAVSQNGAVRQPAAPAAPASAPDRSPPLRDARVELALTTFPALQTHAKRFCGLRDCLVLFSIIWFFLTGLTYWDVALGRSVLQRLDQFWKEASAAVQANTDLLNPNLCGPYQDGDANLPPAKTDPENAKKLAVTCYNFQSVARAGFETREELTRVFRCSDREWTAWFHVWCWGWVLAGDVEHSEGVKGTSVGGKPAVDQVRWQSAESVLSVFSTYILPMMFGLLGTLIGAFRSIHAKVRDSELAPRDYALTILGLPLGAVAGVAVGLYFSPSSVPMQGSGGISGALTLTASGLGFLAGYGSQTFFKFVDDLLARVFRDSTPTRAPPLPTPSLSAPAPAAAPPETP
jgi:hypothetical protein